MVESSVPQVDVGLDLESFGVHGQFQLVHIDDEILNFSTSMNDKLTRTLNEVTSSVEPNLHPQCLKWYVIIAKKRETLHVGVLTR